MKKFLFILILIFISILFFKSGILIPAKKQTPLLENIPKNEEITPTDVYYLAKSIDDCLIRMHNLYTVFKKERITNNAKPKNVYQRVLSVAEEFSYLHRGILGRRPIALSLLTELETKSTKSVEPQPRDVYMVLLLIKNELVLREEFIAYAGQRHEKSPSDVYHMVRQISFHHLEIAGKKNPLLWNKPERVFDINFFEVHSLLIYLCKENGISPAEFTFPLKPAENIKPKDVYQLQIYLHSFLKEYYFLKDLSYLPVKFEQIIDIDSINPGDVFDLTQIILGELKSFAGISILPSRKTRTNYYNWKNKKKDIFPGDVYNLVQHNTLLAKELLKVVGKN